MPRNAKRRHQQFPDFRVLQGYYGGMYVSNFNSFGKLYKVMIQADPSMRTDEESLNQIMVRNGLEMVPVSQFVKLHRVYGPDYVGRFNLYTSINVNGVPPQASVLDKLSKPLPRWQKHFADGLRLRFFGSYP